MRRVSAALAAVAIAAAGTATATAGQRTGSPASLPNPPTSPPAVSTTTVAPLRSSPPWIVDEYGRVVILHGVNVVDKIPPLVPNPDEFGPADADLIASMGFNVVRFGIFWEAAEPAPGLYDDAYLDQVAAIVDLLASRGIWVLLDMHQDLYGPKFLHLDPQARGAPLWATYDDGLPAAWTPFWGLGYLLPGVSRSFDNLYLNRAGIGDSFARMWGHVAARFSGTSNVIGYEIMNEPWPGTLWFLPLDNLTLGSLYRKVVREIRAADPSRTIYYEPPASSYYLLPSSLQNPGDDNVALSYHVYCPPDVIGIYMPLLCEAWGDLAFGAQRQIRNRNRAGWALTEWGFTSSEAHVAQVARHADEWRSGWMYWDWRQDVDAVTGRLLDDTKSVVVYDRSTGALVLSKKAPLLERTYPQATAGVPHSWTFDPRSGAFDFVFTPDRAIEEPTVVFVALSHYPRGYTVTVTGGEAEQVEGAFLHIRPDDTSARVTVRVRAK